MNNSQLLKWVGIIAGVLAVIGGYFYPGGTSTIVQSFGTTSGNSSTRSTAGFAFNPTSASATTTSSLLNSDGNDRVITSVDTACSGLGTSQTAYSGSGLAALNFQIATTSTSAPVTLGNTNYIYNSTIATSSTTFYESTSTPGLTAGNLQVRRWPASTYVTVSSNATNTAACIINVNYLQGLGV